jgi:hypothetical protein
LRVFVARGTARQAKINAQGSIYFLTAYYIFSLAIRQDSIFRGAAVFAGPGEDGSLQQVAKTAGEQRDHGKAQPANGPAAQP